MKIGYACLLYGVRDINYKTVTLKNVQKLEEVIVHNLNTLEKMLQYNVKNKIKMIRITSDLIPFGGNNVNKINWRENYVEKFQKLNELIVENDIRISMHPGQYTVLNSPKEEVVDNSIRELRYHADLLDLLCKKSDIILHIGGVYGDKESAMSRFVENYKKLPDNVVEKLVIENDDKSYTVEDVLKISKLTNLPVVFDNLHHKLNPSLADKSEMEVIKLCLQTWDRKPKIHYSDQDLNKKKGSHSENINVENFIRFIEELKEDIDIMLEVKDKNLSAIKCNNIVNNANKNQIYEEWAKYKYKVLSTSPKIYNEIRKLLNTNYEVKDFYILIDQALKLKEKDENALSHIYGHFKKIATTKELDKIRKLLENKNLEKAKKELEKLTIKYEEKYLINSYYFLI